MRGLTDIEASLLEAMLSHPVEFAMCDERCAEAEVVSFTGGDKTIGDGLLRDARIVAWPCAHRANFRHGRITHAGVLALRMRSFL